MENKESEALMLLEDMSAEEYVFDSNSNWTPLALSFQNSMEDIAIHLVSIKGISKHFKLIPMTIRNLGIYQRII